MQRAWFGQTNRKHSRISFTLSKLLCLELWLDYKLDSGPASFYSSVPKLFPKSKLLNPKSFVCRYPCGPFSSHVYHVFCKVLCCDSKSWTVKLGHTVYHICENRLHLAVKLTSGWWSHWWDSPPPPTFSSQASHKPVDCVLMWGGQTRLSLAQSSSALEPISFLS